MRRSAASRQLASLLLAGTLLASAGCHRVIIDSGLEPAGQVHHEEWNIAFAAAIFPAKIDGSEYCGGRWSRVETKHSFLNGVVALITAGIITPMDVRVVCAERQARHDEDLSRSVGDEDTNE